MLKARYKAAILILAGLIAGGFGLFFMLQPGNEQEALDLQSVALMDSIEQGESRITLNKPLIAAKIDYYDAPEEQDLIPLEGVLPVSEEEAAQDQAGAQQITGMGILEIEKIDLKMPVSYGAGDKQLKVSAGWIPQTAQIGGFGNAVIAGHRNYAYGSHFNRLGELSVGDAIQYSSIDGETMQFIIVETLEVLPSDPVAFEQDENVQMLTLYTCTPIRSATHRLLVRAVRVA